jgi:hypothetical protein
MTSLASGETEVRKKLALIIFVLESNQSKDYTIERIVSALSFLFTHIHLNAPVAMLVATI